MYGNDNKQYICEIVSDLCNSDRSIYILDAGAGTGNVGKVVSTISTTFKAISVVGFCGTDLL